jgi:hypothetical protein
VPTVRISYHPDNSLIGTTRDVTDDEARELVRDGRAVVIDDTDELMGMTKAELIKHAARVNVPVAQSATKEDIAEAIRAAQTSGEASTAVPGGAGPIGGSGPATASTGTGPGAATSTSVS